MAKFKGSLYVLKLNLIQVIFMPLGCAIQRLVQGKVMKEKENA